jgi:hypothetical protein
MTRNRKPHARYDPIAVADARAVLDGVQLEAADLVGGRCIGRTFEPSGEPLAAKTWLLCMCGSSLRAAMSSIMRAGTDSVGLAHRVLLPE